MRTTTQYEHGRRVRIALARHRDLECDLAPGGALIEALKLLTAKDAPFDTSMPTLVRPDSEYAAKIAVGISKPKKNKQLAEEAAELWKLAKEMRGGKLWLAMVRAHGERRGGVRHEHNHAVDRLAADGADGRVLSRADLAAGARD